MPALIGMSNAAWKRQPSGQVGMSPFWTANGLTLLSSPTSHSQSPLVVNSSSEVTSIGVGYNSPISYDYSKNIDYALGVSLFFMIFCNKTYFSAGPGRTRYASKFLHPDGFSFRDGWASGGFPGNQIQSFVLTYRGVADYSITLPSGTLVGLSGKKTVGVRFANNKPIDSFVDGIKYERSGNTGVVRQDTQPVTFSDSTDGQPMVLAALFEKMIGDEAYIELNKNPWQLFTPAPSRFYLIPTAPALTIPTLSNPGVTDIGSTSVRPQVTLTY